MEAGRLASYWRRVNRRKPEELVDSQNGGLHPALSITREGLKELQPVS
jgi:hypothetical protein